MAEPNIARPPGATLHARRKGFGAFCALVAVLIVGLLVNPFSASAQRGDQGPARSHDRQHTPRPDRGAASVASPVASPTVAPAAPEGVEAGSTLDRLIAAGEPISCGAGTQPLVALTFDDGPGVNTQTTLDLLEARGMTATFFTVGKLYDAAPGWAALLRVEARLGAVGDHTWDHVSVRGMSTAELDAQIAKTQRVAEQLSGRPVVLFRPPLGARDEALDRYVRSRGMITVMWSIDSGDSQGASADEIYATIRDHLSPGDIVLLHEGRGTTQNALPAILDLIEARGYTTVTVPQLLQMDPPTNEQLRQHTCPA